MILVKVGRMGGKIREYALAEDCSGRCYLDLDHALAAAGITITSEEDIMLNGNLWRSGLQFNLRSGDILIVRKKEVSSTITVKIGKVGTPLACFSVNRLARVCELIDIADIVKHTDEDIWLQRTNHSAHRIVPIDEPLQDKDVIILEKKKDLTRDKVIEILEEINPDGLSSIECAADEIIEIVKKG